ncbi:hypothetical protein MHTCC0001_31070 [Flavobacteriaceae bacterium MHTCC 0001]
MKINFLNSNLMKTTKFLFGTLFCLALVTSCSDDDTPKSIEEEEAITKLVLTFTNEIDDTDTVVLTWNDDNENEEVEASEKTVVGEFEAGEVYDAAIELFNKDEDFLDEDILENQASIDAHFFVYATTLDFTMARADGTEATRTDNNKLGVKTTWTAGAAGTGSISIELHHESPSVSDNDGFGTAEGDDTDIAISFDAEIQ